MKHFHKTAAAAASLLLSCCLLAGCGETSDSTAPTAELTTTTTAQTTETAAETAAETAEQTTESASETAAETQTTEAASDAPETTSAPEAPAGTTAPASSEAPAVSSATQKQEEKSFFDEIRPGLDCTAYVKAHKDYTLTESDSCLGRGKDREYLYKDFVIFSYADETGRDVVQEVDVSGKSIATRKGITVGMKTDDITAAYGAADSNGEYIYHTGDGVLEFIIGGDDDKTVLSIFLYAEG